LTCSADGKVKLLSVEPLEVVHTWNVAEDGGQESDKVPLGGMQVGCTFVQGDVPVTVGLNGHISMLPKPPMLESGNDTLEILTGHNAPIAGLAIGVNGVMYTGDTDGVVCEWSLATNKAIQRIQPSDSTDMIGKMHGEAVISCLSCNSSGSLLTAGWDDMLRVVSNKVVADAIALEAQPNAMSSGSQLTAILTVSGIVLVKGGSIVSPGLLRLGFSALSVCKIARFIFLLFPVTLH
jgi:WD40 repeat protein